VTLTRTLERFWFSRYDSMRPGEVPYDVCAVFVVREKIMQPFGKNMFL
jgi:hypothetical protein